MDIVDIISRSCQTAYWGEVLVYIPGCCRVPLSLAPALHLPHTGPLPYFSCLPSGAWWCCCFCCLSSLFNQESLALLIALIFLTKCYHRKQTRSLVQVPACPAHLSLGSSKLRSSTGKGGLQHRLGGTAQSCSPKYFLRETSF